jgi:hypothetical protein
VIGSDRRTIRDSDVHGLAAEDMKSKHSGWRLPRQSRLLPSCGSHSRAACSDLSGFVETPRRDS